MRLLLYLCFGTVVEWSCEDSLVETVTVCVLVRLWNGVLRIVWVRLLLYLCLGTVVEWGSEDSLDPRKWGCRRVRSGQCYSVCGASYVVRTMELSSRVGQTVRRVQMSGRSRPPFTLHQNLFGASVRSTTVRLTEFFLDEPTPAKGGPR